jgi:hypothetical protein
VVYGENDMSEFFEKATVENKIIHDVMCKETYQKMNVEFIDRPGENYFIKDGDVLLSKVR